MIMLRLFLAIVSSIFISIIFTIFAIVFLPNDYINKYLLNSILAVGLSVIFISMLSNRMRNIFCIVAGICIMVCGVFLVTPILFHLASDSSNYAKYFTNISPWLLAGIRVFLILLALVIGLLVVPFFGLRIMIWSTRIKPQL
jgi:hypothetical protein